MAHFLVKKIASREGFLKRRFSRGVFHHSEEILVIMPALSHTVQLRQRISAFIEQRNAEGLRATLSALRNADFRTASQYLGQMEVWRVLSEEEFWRFFRVLAVDNAKAYVGTLIKVVVALNKRQKLAFDSEDFRTFTQEEASAIDRRKMLEAFLPLMQTPECIEHLMSSLLRVEDSEHSRVMILFKAGTTASYFLLFTHLKQMDADNAYLRRLAVELIRKGDKSSFNLAAILQRYFDLGTLPGTFSLQMPPYELSRLDQSYDNFLKILLR